MDGSRFLETLEREPQPYWGASFECPPAPQPRKRAPLTDEQRLNLDRLAFALRNLELVRPGFKWDYGNYATCAIGLFSSLQGVGPLVARANAEYFFGMNTAEAADIFEHLAGDASPDKGRLPQDVAADVEAYTKRRLAV